MDSGSRSLLYWELWLLFWWMHKHCLLFICSNLQYPHTNFISKHILCWVCLCSSFNYILFKLQNDLGIKDSTEQTDSGPCCEPQFWESHILVIEMKEVYSAVLLSPPQIPAGLHYNFGDFELEEKISIKSSGILRTTWHLSICDRPNHFVTYFTTFYQWFFICYKTHALWYTSSATCNTLLYTSQVICTLFNHFLPP